jgi:hypothetical protein
MTMLRHKVNIRLVKLNKPFSFEEKGGDEVVTNNKILENFKSIKRN